VAAIATCIAPSDPRIGLRDAEAQDEPFLRDLFRTVKGAQLAAGGLPPGMLELVLAQQYGAQTAGYAAQFPQAQSLLVLEDGAPVGRLLLDCTAARWHVIDIALAPAARKRGIGRAVMTAVIAAARGEGTRAVTLTVVAANEGARRFYGRLGFAEEGADPSASYVAMQIVMGG
jgi:ribosomal protein S18 acetylase RimI-like enzyme